MLYIGGIVFPRCNGRNRHGILKEQIEKHGILKEQIEKLEILIKQIEKLEILKKQIEKHEILKKQTEKNDIFFNFIRGKMAFFTYQFFSFIFNSSKMTLIYFIILFL